MRLERSLAIWNLPENWTEIASFYIEALEDLPGDLVERALRNARLSCKWFPKPAELRTQEISNELQARRREVLRQEQLVCEYQAPRVIMSDAERHKMANLLADLGKALRGDEEAKERLR